MWKMIKKIPTTKLWGILSWVVAISLTIVAVITQSDAMITLCGLAYGEVSVFTAVYANKAKAENKLKISYGFIKKLADKYGIENIIPILEKIIEE